jgi:hypothetical protein
LKIRCAWCKRNYDELEISEEIEPVEGIVSHGICIDCVVELDIFELVDTSEVDSHMVKACIHGEFVVDRSGLVKGYGTQNLDLDGTIHQEIIGKHLLNEIKPFKDMRSFSEKFIDLKTSGQTRGDTVSVLMKHNSSMTFLSLEIMHFADSDISVILARRISSKHE